MDLLAFLDADLLLPDIVVWNNDNVSGITNCAIRVVEQIWFVSLLISHMHKLFQMTSKVQSLWIYAPCTRSKTLAT
jgi:hypothetical protein